MSARFENWKSPPLVARNVPYSKSPPEVWNTLPELPVMLNRMCEAVTPPLSVITLLVWIDPTLKTKKSFAVPLRVNAALLIEATLMTLTPPLPTIELLKLWVAASDDA